MNRSIPMAALTTLIGIGLAAPAAAYVGPGAGVTLIGALIGFVSVIFLSIFAVLRWPIRRYLARRKAARAAAESGDESGPDTKTQ